MSAVHTSVHFEEQAVERVCETLDQSHLPGAAVGIALGGTPVYRKAFGLSNMEQPVAITPQTKMRIYSITKHFTCLLYLLLCEEGEAELDDPIGKYLPELHPVTHRVTMRQLMTHTSGLRDACDIRWLFSGTSGIVAASDPLMLYRDMPDVNFPPGWAWQYNNGAYHILSAVIERLFGGPLEELFRDRIFGPVGMHDTLLRRVDSDFVANSASMHLLGSGGRFEKKFLGGELVGEGGIVSTVDDMLRWMRNMARPVVGRADTWALVGTSHKLNDGAETGYGLGLIRRPHRGMDAIWHAGGGLGSNSQMIRVPRADLDVVVLVNRSDVSALELAARILNACLGTRSEPVSAATATVVGFFRSPTTGRTIRLDCSQDRQMVAIEGGENEQVMLTGDHELGPPPYSCWPFAVRWNGESRPERIGYECYGTKDELLAVPEHSRCSTRLIEGDYRADGIGAKLEITQDSRGRRLITSGTFGCSAYGLEELASGIWRLKSRDDTGWSGILTPEAGGEGLMLHTSANWKMLFRRSA